MAAKIEILILVAASVFISLSHQYETPKALYSSPVLNLANNFDEKSSSASYVAPPGYPAPATYSTDYYPASAATTEYSPYMYMPPVQQQPAYETKEEETSTNSYVQEEEEEEKEEYKPAEGDKTMELKDVPDDPLNFLNLLGSDFQPGRLVNIFFGLFILLFMLVAQGYAMWVFGIAFLPGTRSLNDWKLNVNSLDEVLATVIDAFEYWENKQIKQTR